MAQKGHTGTVFKNWQNKWNYDWKSLRFIVAFHNIIDKGVNEVSRKRSEFYKVLSEDIARGTLGFI